MASDFSKAFVPAEPVSVTSPLAVANEAAIFDLLDLSLPELAAVRAAVAAYDWPAAKQAWARHLSTRTTPRWLWSRRDRPAFQKIYADQFGGLARYTNAANVVLARDFTLLGVRKQLTNPVPEKVSNSRGQHGLGWRTLPRPGVV